MMDEQTFEATDPIEVADRLNPEVVQWLDGVLYVREKDNPYSELYSIAPVKSKSSESGPADLRMCVRKLTSHNSKYVGEEYHSPREAATHAGLTVIDELPSGTVVALDGFGRRYSVQPTGNGPISTQYGWASKEELSKWAPQHRPAKRTKT